MNQADFRVRRATLDDLPGLIGLWSQMHLATLDLERRLTEFQVVESPAGELIGTVGVELNGRHARIHSEAFSDFAVADIVRPLLWDRFHALALNHGLVRFWTQETAPFWGRNGMTPPDDMELKRLPATWAALPGKWLTVELRDEAAVEGSLEKEFSRLKEMERVDSDRALRPARVMKTIATWAAIILAILVLVFVFTVLKNRALLQGGGPL